MKDAAIFDEEGSSICAAPTVIGERGGVMEREGELGREGVTERGDL